MRIALISCGFIDYTINLANALCERGIDVLLIMPNFQMAEYLSSIGGDVKTFIYSQPRLFHPLNISLAYKIYKQILLFNPEIIHIQGGNPWLSILLTILRIKGFIVITTMHDVVPHPGEKYAFCTKFMNYLAIHHSNKIIVHGKFLRKLMGKKYNLSERKISEITIGEHNTEPFLKYITSDKQEVGKFVLFFGRIYKYKGLDYLIRAEPIISQEIPGVKIIIAGAGEDFGRYKSLIKNDKNFMIYNHHISYEEGAELFQKSKIVILPYIEASQSGVVSTAYGFRKPVIATNVGSIPEIVIDGVTGLIVPPKDHVALAKAVIRLLRDEDLRKQLGENAYRKLKTDMSWEKISGDIVRIYEDTTKEINAIK